MLLNGFFKGQRKIDNAKPSGLLGIADFSEQGSSSLMSPVGKALLCTARRADELNQQIVDCFLSPHGRNSPRPGKALAGKAQHQEARRAPSQDITTRLFAAQQSGRCVFG